MTWKKLYKPRLTIE